MKVKCNVICMLVLALCITAIGNAELIYSSDFTGGLPSGTTVTGSAAYDSNYVRLTNTTSQQGTLLLPGPNKPLPTYHFYCDLFIGGGGLTGADGVCFSYGNIADGANFGEAGLGSGLELRIRTYTNRWMELRYNGANVATWNWPSTSDAEIHTDSWVSIQIMMMPDGRCTVVHNRNRRFGPVAIPGWNPQSNWRMAVGARTGGAWDNQRVDNIRVSTSEPFVNSIARASANPVGGAASSVQYSVSLVEPVNNLDTADFNLTQISGTPTATIASVSNASVNASESFGTNGSPGIGTFGGTATTSNGELRLTEAVNSVSGFWYYNPGKAMTAFHATYALRVGGGSGADGSWFCYAPWSAPSTEGDGVGLYIIFDSYNNGGETTPDISVKYNNNVYAVVRHDFRGDVYRNVSVTVTTDGLCTVVYDGIPIVADLMLAGWNPLNTWRVGFGGFTGGLNDRHYVDNFTLVDNVHTVTLNNLGGAGQLRMNLNGAVAPDKYGAAMTPNSFASGQTYDFDFIAPNAVCQNISRTLPGPIAVTAAEIDGGSTDNVGITVRTINGGASQTYTSANVGANSATLLVGDAVGNTATCTATVTILKGNSTITATGATSYTYTGNPQGPDTAAVSGSTGAVTYSYSGTGATSYGPSSTKPTNAGAYQAVATLAADANYNGATSAPLAFTIAKAASTIVATGETDYTYTGAAQGPDASTVTGSTGLVTYSYSGTGATSYGPSSTKPTNAGTYEASATVADDANHNGAASAPLAFTIAKAASTIVVTGETDYTYTGAAQGPDTANVTGSTGLATHSYSGTGATSYGPSSTKPTNAGTYEASATVADDANHNGAASAPLAFTIAKAASTIVVTGETDYTYTGAAQGPDTANVTGSTGLATYSYSGTGATSYGPSSTKPTNAGTYEASATVADDANHNGATSALLAFTIAKAASSIVATGETDYTYTGAAQGPDASTVTGSMGLATYSYSGSGYGPSAVKPTNAGAYEMVATVAADENYTGAVSAPLAFAIQKATPTATLAVTNSPVIYNGAARTAIVSVTASSTSGAAVTVETGGAASQTNAGVYAVTANFLPADTANYNTLTGLSAGNFVIDKAAITVELVDVIKLWDGNTDVALVPANFSVQGLASGESLVISQTAGAFDSAAIGASVPVSATLSGFIAAGPGTNLDNYALPDTAAGLGTITDKFIPVVTWPTASAIVFGQALSASTLSGGAATDPYTSAPVDGTFAFDDDSITPSVAGSYNADATFTPTDATTYASRQTQIPVLVQKATPVIVAPPTASVLRAGQSLANSALTGGEASVDGDFVWNDGALVPPLGVSVQWVAFMAEAANNHEVVLLEVSVTVVPAADFVLAAVGETYFVRPLGGAATFRVEAQNAAGAVSYQWYKLMEDKALLPVGADAPMYAIGPIGAEDYGEYQCEATDAALAVTVESPVFTLAEGTGVPAAGLLGLALASALTALTGASLVRRKR